jgi:hypothetical protein
MTVPAPHVASDIESPEDRAAHAQLLRWAGRIGVAAWAGVWLVFVALSAFSEGATALWPAAALAAALALCVVTVWTRPVLGGVLLNVAGVVAAASFHHPAARALLAAPAVFLGVVAILGAIRGRESG